MNNLSKEAEGAAEGWCQMRFGGGCCCEGKEKVKEGLLFCAKD